MKRGVLKSSLKRRAKQNLRHMTEVKKILKPNNSIKKSVLKDSVRRKDVKDIFHSNKKLFRKL